MGRAVSSVEFSGAGATDGLKKGELGLGHCTLTRKLLPSAPISPSSLKKVCSLLF